MARPVRSEAEEVERLRRALNDLVATLALPAFWTGGAPEVVATTLLDVLLRMLGLDFAYLRLNDPSEAPPGAWSRIASAQHGAIPSEEIGEILRPHLVEPAAVAGRRVPSPLGEGTVSIAVFPLGVPEDAGRFVAGSARSDFPTDLERLVLQVGTNQATIALREASLITQLRRATERLEARVAERTSELTAANDALREEAAERRRGERTLAETEARLEQMAEAVPEVIWIAALEPEERVVYCNPSFERVWGLPLDELYRNPRLWTEAIHPEDRARVETVYARWIAGTGIDYQDVDFRIVRPDGSLRWIHEHGVLARNEQGRPIRASGISTDVTERKEAEGELARAFDEIRELKDRLQQENIALREEVEKTSMFEEVVGISEPIRAVLTQVARVAPTDTTVLVSGETGTGKELVARAIHKLSRRSNRALICVNCAAIPPSLIASELFGHEKGAFTGAWQRRRGRFELADGGTIFLDEVGELPAETQMALLRVLQEREFERVGGGGRPIRTDVRVIAASNRDLEAEVSRDAFRADLFYRLNVFPIEIPPLRERRADIAVLVEYFIHRYARRAGRRIRGLHEAALELLRSYDWPGNVRELQNVIERAMIVSDSETLSIDERWLSGRPRVSPVPSERPRTLANRERGAIEDVLVETRGRVSGPFGAATRLGIPSSTLESKIRALKIDKKRFRTTSGAILR